MAKQVNPNAKYFGSAWSPPAWMKTNGELNHGGFLKDKPGSGGYKAFAHYLVKYV
jgi:glucosylceramidase